MKKHVVLLCFLVGSFTGCSRGYVSSTLRPPSLPPATPITGHYCTTWDAFVAKNGAPAFAVVCLQDDGSWAEMSTEADIGPTCAPSPWSYSGLELSRAPNGDLLLLMTCEATRGGERSFIVKRHSSVTNLWADVSNTPVNWDPITKQVLPFYTQFGASLLSWGQSVGVFWTATSLASAPSFASLQGATWINASIPAFNRARHPEVYTNGQRAFLHIGEPQPQVWEVTSGTPVSLGAVPAPGQYTLYTSMTLWNGQPVLAYSSATPFDAPSESTTDRTKVAFRQANGSWLDSGSSVQETPGHDGTKPYLFVISNELYVLYSDYTTQGMPTYPNIITRFRVKKWNGSSWIRVGNESGPIWLSQRFEFLQDGNQILVSVIRAVTPTQSERIVLGWNTTDGFIQVGHALAGWASGQSPDSRRPGAVVSLH